MGVVKPESGLKERVAELLSLGLQRSQICERLRISVGSYSGQFDRIKRDLGWQAR